MTPIAPLPPAGNPQPAARWRAAFRSAPRRLLDQVNRVLAGILIQLVRFYQTAISPLLGNHCRYIPSCSEYFIQAVRKYGPLRGSIKGVLRICRCHPFRPGGYDPP